jgi:hypothetical protein
MRAIKAHVDGRFGQETADLGVNGQRRERDGLHIIQTGYVDDGRAQNRRLPEVERAPVGVADRNDSVAKKRKLVQLFRRHAEAIFLLFVAGSIFKIQSQLK